jgi:hydroxymethylbilane synthase
MGLIIASRKSALALWQSEFVKKTLETISHKNIEIIKVVTKGDKILDTPLANIGGKGLFTKEIEQYLIDDRADIAVHSLKDMPTAFDSSLSLSAVTKREISNDAFLSMKYKSLDDLPNGAIVGTTSLRRRMQVLRYRNNLTIKDIRGNINTRISKLVNGEYDAIILAYAGVKRLNLSSEVKYFETIDKDILLPSMGQASLAIQTRNNEDIKKIVLPLNHTQSYIETKLERDFVHKLNAGCQAPIGVHAIINGDTIKLSAMLGLIDGTKILEKTVSMPTKDAIFAGEDLANDFIDMGAFDILEQSKKMFLQL